MEKKNTFHESVSSLLIDEMEQDQLVTPMIQSIVAQ
jgi:hypothetical protein